MAGVVGYPVGFRFKPTPTELVQYYLLPKLQGKATVPNDAIIEADVYECDPEILIQKYRHRGETHWYFLSPRTRKYKGGVRPSRRTADNRGRWKPSSGISEKTPEAFGDGQVICGEGTVKFCVNSLAYHVGPGNDEKKTKWLMQELTVPEYEIKLNSGAHDSGSMLLDRYAMCDIYISPLGKWHTDEDGDTSAAREVPAPESGQGTSSAPTTLSDKQAGKRPVVKEEQLGKATAKKRARQQARGKPPAPVHGNPGVAMGVPPLRAGGAGFCMIPGQPAQMPWPPLTSSGLQGPVQLPQQRMYQHYGSPLAAPYHVQRQMPMQGLAGSGLRRPVSAAHNSLDRAMVTRPLPSPFSFEKEIMTMHPRSGMVNLAAGQTRPPPDMIMNDPCTQLLLQVIAERGDQESAPQQQDLAASNLLPLPPQQPTFDAGANHPVRDSATVPHPGGGDQQHQQRVSTIPATSVSVSGNAAAATEASGNASNELPALGDAEGGSGNGGLDSYDDQTFADLPDL